MYIRGVNRDVTQGGVALVMTILVLSMTALLLVGFLSTMRLERRAANAYEDTQRAKLVAQGAVSHAIDLLRTNIPEPARLSEGPKTAPGENWAVNPGRLTVIRDGTAPQYIDLHTGAVDTEPDSKLLRDAESVDLNQPLPGETEPAITGTNLSNPDAKRPEMRVRWRNLLKDPSHSPGKDNPLVGRYAFWMDDESARVNFNVALGKPLRAGTPFGDHIEKGFMTPLFTRGGGDVNYGGTGQRQWALGRPQSINLDLLFDNPNQLQHDRLLAHTFLHGFSRYPEAILNFVNVPSPRAWFAEQKFNLTFYSRSPEFNAFGRSRLFTTYVPLSLEAGPTYQQPFVFDPTERYTGATSEVLHLNSLLGTFGFTSKVEDEDGGGEVNGGNVVNRSQVEMLVQYLNRKWPGYGRSFVDKYGLMESYQIALNAVLMARMATTRIGTDLTTFSRDWGLRTTSVNYSPSTDELPGSTPERFYWRFPQAGKTVLMLPQTPGPHITEVRLITRSIAANPAPRGNPNALKGYTTPRYVEYWYEIEYYVHPLGPVVDLAEFPTRMDYLDITTAGSFGGRRQQFGPSAPGDNRPSRNWNHKESLARLKLVPEGETILGPAGAKFGGKAVRDRKVFKSPRRVIGQREGVVPSIEENDFDPFIFDAAKDSSVTVKIRFRPGMGITSAPGRPRQMIPLGEYAEDTLKATFNVSLSSSSEQAYSWQINDPRLSAHLAQWEKNIEGPGSPATIGTPDLVNRNEPSDSSTEKSKFRYIQRAPDDAKIATYAYDRPDEYNTRSRISSPGYWSVIHTGIQSQQPWRTLNLSEEAAKDSPPDWLFLDLIGATYPMAHDQWKIDSKLPDEFSTVSYMNSTAGQINLNSRIYPQSRYFQPPERRKPLEAVFQNLRSNSDVKKLVDHIIAYQTDEQVFDYVGELANVPGYNGSGTTQWQREELLRNMTGSLTTKSNTFGVWGVSQVVKKSTKAQKYDVFEQGDQVLAEKRFYALVERYIWAGLDGVPGNAHVGNDAKWDRLARQKARISTSEGLTDTLFQLPGSPPMVRAAGTQRLDLDPTGSYAEFDGPERVGMNPYVGAALGNIRYRKSSLEEAYNPPQALVKYRVVYFKYLDQ